jgi:hypothetical protein
VPISRPSGDAALIRFSHKNAVQMASGLLIEGLLILVLIIANGIFSGSEIAVVSARKVRLEQQAERGERRRAAAGRRRTPMAGASPSTRAAAAAPSTTRRPARAPRAAAAPRAVPRRIGLSRERDSLDVRLLGHSAGAFYRAPHAVGLVVERLHVLLAEHLVWVD